LVKWDLKGVRDPKEPGELMMSRDPKPYRKTGNSAHEETSMMTGTTD